MELIYLEYEIYKRQYIEAKNRYNEILEEKEFLFTRTQPNAVRYDQDKVQTSNNSNVLESYVIAKEQRHIEQRLAEAKEILESRADFLKYIEKDLRASKHIADIVYCCRFLDCMRVKKIMKITNYSKSQICRILDSIRKELNERKTNE